MYSIIYSATGRGGCFGCTDEKGPAGRMCTVYPEAGGCLRVQADAGHYGACGDIRVGLVSRAQEAGEATLSGDLQG